MYKILAFGNPLLDTIIPLKTDDLLRKYNLEPDGQKEVTEEEMTRILLDTAECKKTISAGGCAQNTLKLMKWILGAQCHATIFGSIGRDDTGKLLQKLLEGDGVTTNYVTQDSMTGTTISLVRAGNRSLVACLGAAESLSLRSLLDHSNLLNIETTDLIYMEGFFVTKRKDAVKHILQLCTQHNKKFAFNLSGEYLCNEVPELVIWFMKHSNIIFGNRREFQAIYPLMGFQDLNSLLQSLKESAKVLVITDGSHSVSYLSEEESGEMRVPVMEPRDVVDTTGAGDAFVAGFLVGYLLRKSLLKCCQIGCYTAQEIIKHEGCVVPNSKPEI